MRELMIAMPKELINSQEVSYNHEEYVPEIARDPDCEARITHIHANANKPIPIIAEGEINKVKQNSTAVSKR